MKIRVIEEPFIACHIKHFLRNYISLTFRSFNINFNISILIMFFLLSIFVLPTISADVISANSGGTQNLAVTPDRYVEGFFFGHCVPDTCAGLGYTCGSWPNGCGGTLNCGTCGSGYTCSSGTCVSTTTPSGGTTGGGGTTGVTSLAAISTIPSEFNVNLAIDTTVEKVIQVTNTGSASTTVSVSESELGNHVILGSKSLTINPGQTKNLDVIFVALSEPGIYTGQIIIGGKSVLVTLNVKTELLLFDSNIVVLNPNYKVEQGGDLETRVTLIPMGDPARLDVTLNYVIKDYANNIYLTKSETLLVEEQMEIERDFDTGEIPLGDYIIGLELIYPNGVAPSSAHFEIVEKTPAGIFTKVILYLIILILIILILIIIILIWRKLKQRKDQGLPLIPR